MNVLSIQSSVVYGHVGNAAAVLPLQRLGHEVWAVPTVSLSNHQAYDSCRGRPYSPAEVRDLIEGVGERGAFANCAAVLSGYLGVAATGQVVLEAVASIKAANREALYCCDPVMGDEATGLFVAADIPDFFRERALPHADIVLPNAFELATLAELPADSPETARAAAQALRRRGVGLVVATGLPCEGGIEVLADGPTGVWRVRTPQIDVPTYGAGDAFAALFLGNYLSTRDVARALERAVASVYGLLEATRAAGTFDLQLVAAQEEFVAPSHHFPVERLA